MSFQLSPGVNVTEIDLTAVIPSVATTDAAIGGVFRWGPVEKAILVTNEDQLVARFGRPTNLNAETFFTAASFLAYSDSLFVSRAYQEDVSYNAIANTQSVSNAELEQSVVKNDDYYDTIQSFPSGVEWVAKYPGELGNSLRISVCDSAAAFQSTIDLTDIEADTIDESITFTIGSNVAVVSISHDTANTDATIAAANEIAGRIQVGDILRAGSSTFGYQYLEITAIETPGLTGGANGEVQFEISLRDRYILSSNFTDSSIQRRWRYWDVVNLTPSQSAFQLSQGNTAAQDELHVVVSDEDGKITGVPGTIIEVFDSLSRATDARNADGGSNHYKEVINSGSRFVWFANDRTGAVSATADLLESSTNDLPYDVSFVEGADTQAEFAIPAASVMLAYDEFKSAEDFDISLVLAGKARGTLVANYIIDNIVEFRKDCIVLISPELEDVVNNTADIEDDVIDFRNALRSTSYAVMDSGYKYMYDKYNDIYRWIPLNGDVGGLCARTDDERDAWFSPAGFNRGQIRNIVKLAWNPKQAERDLLYKNGINPVVNFPGQGIILFGDKTLLSRPSAFDRINVRRLFIVLEKAIARASQSTLFEFNDEFTRSSFVNLVTPFLRGVQGRRGITDFAVICDETNNTGEVIDRNEFIGDIYIKPARAINFIQLNFVAVRTGVEFSEIIGQF